MEEKLVVSRDEAIERGFLQNKVVYLKPAPRGGKMIKSPVHVGYFMYEGAKSGFVLPRSKRGELVNVFSNKEEQSYFERELGVDLNPNKKTDNFWHTFVVSFTKSPATMHDGMKFNLADPLDNLRVRVLKHCPEVAPDWDSRYDFPSYRFALVEEDYEENKASLEAIRQQEIWQYFGSIMNNAKKMTDFVSVYLAVNKKSKNVPSDATKEWLMKEIGDVIKEDPDGFLEVVDDPDFEIKSFVMEAVKVGAIEKSGVNKYVIPGETTSWSLIELVAYLKDLQENSDDIYLKIKAQIKLKSK